MSTIKRTPGIKPGAPRKASDINAQVDEFKDQLGYQPDATTGEVGSQNIHQASGIREDKILWDPTFGHNHPHGAGASGARLATNSVTDFQLSWSTGLQFAMGNRPGMIVRAGFWHRAIDPNVTGGPASPAILEEHTYFIPFSYPPRTEILVNTEDAGALFPETAIPNVVVTLVWDSDEYPINNGTPAMNWFIEDGSITSKGFSLTLHIKSGSVFAGNEPYATGLLGFNWVAVYDPSSEG